MKIAIEAQRIFRKKKHGMDIVALELIRRLQQIDHKNEYYILVKKDEDNRVLSETKNFHIVELPGAPYPIWEQYYLPKAVKRISPDLLHCTSNTAPLKMKVPLVLTLHDILYMQKIDLTKGSWYQRIGNLYRKWLVPRIINNCKTIITVSDFEKNEINRQFQFKEDKVRTVYNAFSRKFQQSTDAVKLEMYRNKYHLPEQYVLFLGNTHPNKNMRNVLIALSRLHKQGNFKIPLVLPDVDESFLQKVIEEIHDPELKNKIILTGYVPNHELVYIYNLATVFLYPSFYESFGIPMLEAMSCGVPVIASNRAAMPEISGGAALLINPDNTEEITGAIHQLLTNDHLYETCKKAGLKRANAFCWTLTAFEVLDIYYKIVQPVKTFQTQRAAL